VFPSSQDPAEMHGDSPYNIMFGPDICGPGHRKVHVIFSYKGTNHLVKKTISCKSDTLTHLYTLIVNPDNTYEVSCDFFLLEFVELPLVNAIAILHF
jgi:calreticulin